MPTAAAGLSLLLNELSKLAGSDAGIGQRMGDLLLKVQGATVTIARRMIVHG